MPRAGDTWDLCLVSRGPVVTVTPDPDTCNRKAVRNSTEEYCTVTVQYLDVVEAAGEGEKVCRDHDVRAAEVHHAAPRVPVVANPQLRAVQGRHLRSGCRYVDTSV